MKSLMNASFLFNSNIAIKDLDGTAYCPPTSKKESVSTTLPSRWITAIAINAQGNKWFGADKGVSKLSVERTGIKPIISKNSLQIYPNPVQNILHILFKYCCLPNQ
jgi:ligand-binding sensor domain-containing protein